MAVSTVPAEEWRSKAVSRAQWWKIAHLALELANVDAPQDRGAASDLIVRLDAASGAERAKDDCPFEVAA
jgi:hypothetical protein